MNKKNEKNTFFGDVSGLTNIDKDFFSGGVSLTQRHMNYKHNWSIISSILKTKKGKVLEVGCGRGTISLYFAKKGFKCNLIDIQKNAISIAKDNFKTYGYPAKFNVGDANNLPFDTNSFDIVISMGLLEHFSNPKKPLQEMCRVLKPNGILIAYVIPKRLLNVQTIFYPILIILRSVGIIRDIITSKHIGYGKNEKCFRNSIKSQAYKKMLAKIGMVKITSFGVVPLPQFPTFPRFIERMKIETMKIFLSIRKIFLIHNPWVCSEFWGGAFMIHARKK